MQQVKYAGALSEAIPLISGVAQGSNLGPTLWNIYINGLFHILPYESVVAHADDITIVTYGNTVAECACEMQQILDCTLLWCNMYGLKVNFSKCDYLFVSNRIKKMTAINTASLPNLVLGITKIRITHEIKILGVWLSDSLSWRSHALRVRSRINSMVKILRKVGSNINAETHSKIFNAFGKPHVVYSDTVLGNRAPIETAKTQF